jgi:PAS domain S-box-containing protein
MDTDKFTQKIEKAKYQLEELQAGIKQKDQDQIVIRPEVAQGLMNALEELHVVEEELRQRNQELAQARQALETEKRRYEGLFCFAPDGYLVTDLSAVIREANQAAGDLLGVRPDFLEGRPLAAYVCQSDKKAFRNRLDRLPKIDHVGEWELCLQPRQGGLIPVLATVSVMPLDAKEPDELYWIIHDISARVEAEEALQENLEQYQQFFDVNPEYCYFSSPDGIIIDVNRSALETLGYRKDEIVGKPVETIYAPEYASKARDLVSQWLQTGQLVDEEMVIITKDGERRTVLLSATAVYNNGELDHSISIQKDITERVETRRQLTERNLFIETILDNLPIGLAVNFIDKGTADYINPRFEQIYGWPKEKIKDMVTFFELVYPDPVYREEVKSMVMADIESRDPERMAWKGIEITTAQGEKRIVSARNIPLYDQNLMISTVRDITERVQAEGELKSRNRELATLLDIGQQLTSKLELDTLLQAIADAIVAALPSAEAASLWLYDKENDQMAVRSWVGFEDEMMAGRTLPLDRSLAGRVYSNRQAYIIDDAVEDPDFEHVVHPRLKVIRSVLSAPLLIEDQAVGALFADSFSRAQAFDQGDLRMLWALAHQAAIAFRNALTQQSLQRRSEELRTLAARLGETEETERRRMARELHDQVGQSLAVLSFNLNRAQAEIDTDTKEGLSGVLNESLTLVNEISQDIRDVMDDLRPAVLDDYGLFAALHWLGDRFEERTGIDVRVSGLGTQPRLASPVETALFRITQEALTNVARHAQANYVTLRLRQRRGQVSLEIEDDGIGFDPESSMKKQQKRGWGLINMRERAQAVGGTFEIESVMGSGTKISVELERT